MFLIKDIRGAGGHQICDNVIMVGVLLRVSTTPQTESIVSIIHRLDPTVGLVQSALGLRGENWWCVRTEFLTS